MDALGRQEEKLKALLARIDEMQRKDKRNMQMARLIEHRIENHKLREAGQIFVKAGILDGYDAEAVLNLLLENKDKITGGGCNGKSGEAGGKVQQEDDRA